MTDMPEWIEWALHEEIDMTQTAENEYLLCRIGTAGEWVKVTITQSNDERRMLINGKDIELGDDFIPFISLFDDYHEQNGGEIGQTIRMRPYDDGQE